MYLKANVRLFASSVHSYTIHPMTMKLWEVAQYTHSLGDFWNFTSYENGQINHNTKRTRESINATANDVEIAFLRLLSFSLYADGPFTKKRYSTQKRPKHYSRNPTGKKTSTS